MYAICRIMKLHGSEINASYNHCERITEVKNADKNLSYLNSDRFEDTHFKDWDEDEEYKKYTLKEKIDNYMEDSGIRIPRKDSVMCVELMLAAPPELFKNIPIEELPQNKVFKAWREANYEFIRKEFKVETKEPVIAFYTHLDESTPHIHAHIIPLHYNEKKRQLEVNAKSRFGGIEKMQAFQDRYHKALNENFQQELRFMGLDGRSLHFERGTPKEITGKRHVEIKEYYKAIERASELGVTPKQIEKLIEREFKTAEKSPSKIFETDLKERQSQRDLDMGINTLGT